MKTAFSFDLATQSDETNEMEMLILHLDRTQTYQLAIYEIQSVAH